MIGSSATDAAIEGNDSPRDFEKRPFIEGLAGNPKLKQVGFRRSELKKKPLLPSVSQQEGGSLWKHQVQGSALFICHVLPLQLGVKSPNFLGGKLPSDSPVNQIGRKKDEALPSLLAQFAPRNPVALSPASGQNVEMVLHYRRCQMSLGGSGGLRRRKM